MNIFFKFIIIFYMGCLIGWIIELLYRRIVHKKLVNPGFLIGPYLPIYGFGFIFLTLFYLIFKDSTLHPAIIIILMAILMILIELVGGIIGLKNNIKLWDYSDRWGNYKGIICPLFSAIWTTAGAIYFFIIAPYIMKKLDSFSMNLTISFILGIFTGFIIIDTIYSSKLYVKIKDYAKQNHIIIKYEQFKMHIKDMQTKRKEKYSFVNPFEQTKKLTDYLANYKKARKKRKKNTKFF